VGKETEVTDLFISNFVFSTTDSELFELLESIGVVRSAKVIPGRGFGFVKMADPDDVQRAVEQLDGFTWRGRPLRVALAKSQ
jgi:RNA recognition motif-containing protein